MHQADQMPYTSRFGAGTATTIAVRWSAVVLPDSTFSEAGRHARQITGAHALRLNQSKGRRLAILHHQPTTTSQLNRNQPRTIMAESHTHHSKHQVTTDESDEHHSVCALSYFLLAGSCSLVLLTLWFLGHSSAHGDIATPSNANAETEFVFLKPCCSWEPCSAAVN